MLKYLARIDLKTKVDVLSSAIVTARGKYSTFGILNSGLPDVDIPRVSLDEYVFENIGKWENHIAVKCAATGRRYTYKEVRTKSRNFGAALRKKLKLNKGDVVAVLFPNVPEFFITALGTSQVGLICTAINPLYTPDEISRQIKDCSAKAIITLVDLWPLANDTREKLKRDIPIIVANSEQGQPTPPGAIKFSEFADNHDDIDVPKSAEDVAFLPYSSGTTGLPKGVQLTHFNIIANICQLSHPEVGVNRETTSEYQYKSPTVLPLFHIYGLTVNCMYHLRLGCQSITLPKFTPNLFINVLKNEKPDVLYVAPPIAILLANHPTLKPKDFDSLKAIVNGAAALGALDHAKLIKKAERDIPIVQGYGMTETSPALIFLRLSHLSQKSSADSLGQPIPNTEVKVVAVDDPTGTPLGPNQLGELFVRGPQVMKGYYNRSEEDIFQDGWLRTGDMMSYNEDGFLFISDRLKELIKVKGFQVPPAELEELIRNFPNVAEAAVIGIPHDRYGEVPRAYIVPQDGATVDCDKLIRFVKEKVAPYKHIAGGVIVVDSIPKSPSGKILRRELKLQYQTSG